MLLLWLLRSKIKPHFVEQISLRAFATVRELCEARGLMNSLLGWKTYKHQNQDVLSMGWGIRQNGWIPTTQTAKFCWVLGLVFEIFCHNRIFFSWIFLFWFNRSAGSSNTPFQKLFFYPLSMFWSKGLQIPEFFTQSSLFCLYTNCTYFTLTYVIQNTRLSRKSTSLV